MTTIDRVSAESPVVVAPPTNRQLLARIRARLAAEDISTGILASLRRGDPTTVARQASFHRLLAQENDADLDHDAILRWATAVHLIAIAGRDGHGQTGSDGDALASARYPESRLARLLASRGDGFRAQAVLCARFLRAHNASTNMLDLGELALTEGRRESRAEELRHRLAQDYYRAIDSITR